MDFKDYYAILGVAPEADDKTIKKAYQKLAKQYHPDVNPGDKKAEEKFKEITEAYQAISDSEKRRKYDEIRLNYNQWQQRGGQGDFDWNRWQARPGESGTYTRTMSPEEFAEMFGDSGLGGFGSSYGNGGFSDFFSSIFGMGGMDTPYQTFHRPSQNHTRAGQDYESEVSLTLEESYHGTTRVLATDGKRIEAKIPKGVRTGSKIRLAGQGAPGIAGGPQGDLYLKVTVEPHVSYTREGDNLTTEIAVDFYKAVLGGTVTVHTLGGEVLLKIPSRSQSGTKFRLKGKGMPKLEAPHQYGDLYAQLKIVLPESMSLSEVQAIRDLAEKHGK